MQVYIDNKKTDIQPRRYKSFGNLLKKISKNLENEEKVINNVYYNGQEIVDDKYINMNNSDNILEIETKYMYELLIEHIYNLIEDLETMMEFIGNIYDRIIEYPFKESSEDMHELIDFIFWMNDFLELVKLQYFDDCSHENFVNDLNDFHIITNYLIDALNDKDKEKILYNLQLILKFIFKFKEESLYYLINTIKDIEKIKKIEH